MSQDSNSPIGYSDRDWVFGPFAGIFACISTIIFTGMFVVFLAKAYSASQALNSNLAELSHDSKIELSARLLRIPGIDPVSVAEYLKSKNPDEIIVEAKTQEANEEARRVMDSHKRTHQMVSNASVFGIQVTRASVFVATTVWLFVTCVTLAVAGRGRVQFSFR